MRRDRDGADERSARWCSRLTVGATALFLLLVTRWRPWLLFARGGYTTDFYEAQARAMWHLRLDVPEAVAGIEGFLVDGRTYLYFGPFLSLVRMPFALVGHAFDGRLTRLSMVLGFAVACSAAHALALEARGLVAGPRPERSADDDHLRIAAFVAACAVSPLLVLAGWPSVYHETEMWGAALCAWTFVHALRFSRAPTTRHALLAAASAAMTVLTRATMGFGAALAVGLVALLVLWRSRRRWRSLLRPVVVAVGGTAAGALVNFAVSYAKLGSLVEMPWRSQQLTLASPKRQAWFAGHHDSFFGVDFLPTTLLHYLRPDTVRFERLAPFVRFGPPASDVGGYPLETASPSASLTATATVLLVLALVGVVLLVRGRSWSWLAVLAGGVLAAIPSFLIGFIGARYLADMVPMLMVPAAVAAVAIRAPSRRGARRLVAGAVGTLLVWGAWSNVALATWLDQLKNPGFTAWRYQLDDVLFGDSAPGIIAVDRTAPVPRDGIVAIEDSATDGAACGAVYIAEQGAWVALERPEGAGRQLTGRLEPRALDAGAATIAGGEDWLAAASRDESGWRITLDAPSGTTTSDAVELDAGTTIRIVRDEVTHELSVSVDGRVVAFSFDTGAGLPVPGDGFAAEPAARETLCRRLQARR